MQKSKFFRLVTGALFVLSAFTFSSTAQELPSITIGHVGHDHQIALGVAAMQGRAMEEKCGAWLEELKPREVYRLYNAGKPLAELLLLKVQGGSGMPAAMERGELDIGLGGVAPVAFFADRGNDFKIIAPLNTDGDMLVMRRGFGASSWKEFIQKIRTSEKIITIGYKAPVAVAKLIFERGLQAEGIDIGTRETGMTEAPLVRMVNLHGQKNMIPSLAAGVVDGFVTNEPAASKAVYKGCGEIVCDLAGLPPEGKWRNHPCCCVAATGQTLREHPQVVRALLKLIVSATGWINEDKQAAAEIASKWTRTPIEVENQSVHHIQYLARPTDSWRQGMITWVEMMQDMGTFEAAFAKERPEKIVDALCNFSFLPVE